MKEAFQAFGEAVKGLVRYPLATFLAFSMYINVFLGTKLLALHESNYVTAKQESHASDTAFLITITTLRNSEILKDTLLAIREREYQKAIKDKELNTNGN